MNTDTEAIDVLAAAEPMATPQQAIVADARAVKARWQVLIAPAQRVWRRLSTEELTKVQGNFHVLSELLQMRYKMSREESDRQVKAFFDEHFGKAGASLRPK